MRDLLPDKLQAYLRAAVDPSVVVRSVAPLETSTWGAAVKGYGFGQPLDVRYESCGQPRRAVLNLVRRGAFGHEHMADRAHQILWGHETYNRLPRHVRAIDVGGIRKGGDLLSLRDVEELFLLVEFAEGDPYACDLHRLAESDELLPADRARADALCDYLVQIHRVRGTTPSLYARRIRELIGHGECIMGLCDSYPTAAGTFPSAALLEEIERRCVTWRWRIKGRTHRLRQVHGDFHPWNILFRTGREFTVLDRSRGEWGEAADDVTCLTINYLFFSLRRHGRLTGALAALFARFWERYLEQTRDHEMLAVAAPFIAFRALVLGNPIWYPEVTEPQRRTLFTLIRRVLDAQAFEPDRINQYCEA